MSQFTSIIYLLISSLPFVQQPSVDMVFGVQPETYEQFAVAEPKTNQIAPSYVLAPLPSLAGGDDEKVELSAKAVYGYDRNTGHVLYEKNKDKKVSIASLTKLMTALVVVSEEGNLEREVKIPSGIPQEGSDMGVLSGEILTIRDLLYGLMVNSGNDAALVLAREVGGSEANFVRLMNLKAKSLGLTHTHYANPTGLDDPENYSTAFEIASLGEIVIHHPVLSTIVSTNEKVVTSRDYTRTTHFLKNTNKLLRESETGVFAGKTGFTDEAGLCLVSGARRNGHEVINVVLGSEDRAEDTRRLLDWEYKHFSWE